MTVFLKKAAVLRSAALSACVLALLVLGAGCSNPSGGGSPPAVYAAGYYNDGAKDVPCYWKDGARTGLELPGGAGDGYAFSIAVAGASV